MTTDFKRCVSACKIRLARFSVFIALSTLLLLSPSALKAQEVLRVGTEGAYPPFNFFDNSGRLSGFDTEIAQALCNEMQVRCQFVLNDWTTIIDGLEQSRYDVIIASMSITEERKRRVLFTNSYYTNALRYITRKERGVFPRSASDVQGLVMGAQRGSIAATYLTENHSRRAIVRLYDTQEDVYLDLLQGRIAIAVSDALPAYDWLQSVDGTCCTFASDPIVADDGIGMAVRQGDYKLRDRLNEALDAILENGTYKEINDRYFPFSIY